MIWFFVFFCSTEQLRDIQVDMPNFGRIHNCMARYTPSTPIIQNNCSILRAVAPIVLNGTISPSDPIITGSSANRSDFAVSAHISRAAMYHYSVLQTAYCGGIDGHEIRPVQTRKISHHHAKADG